MQILSLLFFLQDPFSSNFNQESQNAALTYSVLVPISPFFVGQLLKSSSTRKATEHTSTSRVLWSFYVYSHTDLLFLEDPVGGVSIQFLCTVPSFQAFFNLITCKVVLLHQRPPQATTINEPSLTSSSPFLSLPKMAHTLCELWMLSLPLTSLITLRISRLFA